MIQCTSYTHSLHWINSQHLCDKPQKQLQIWMPIVFLQFDIPILDCLNQRCIQFTIKRRFSKDQLEQEHADGPNVWLLHQKIIIDLNFSADTLRWHIVKRWDVVRREFFAQEARRYAKVCQVNESMTALVLGDILPNRLLVTIITLIVNWRAANTVLTLLTVLILAIVKLDVVDYE